ncbi:MAG: type II toxin-antitoxin system RelE/ParE family toxin [Clostridia bacterium]|nr:type II toxin-antitoxin system RelE/ParE family toxin [Clostridia bacterium]
MKKYKVVFTDKAKKQFKKLDKHIELLLMGWIEKNLEGCSNPRLHGKALIADKTGKWRYRIGNYRLIAQIEDDKIIILILNVGHRREIYKKD